MGVTGEAANNCSMEVVRKDGTKGIGIVRDSTPMTWEMRKQERRKAAEAASLKKAARAAALIDAKEMRLQNVEAERRRNFEDQLRREELGKLLSHSAMASTDEDLEKELFGEFENLPEFENPMEIEMASSMVENLPEFENSTEFEMA